MPRIAYVNGRYVPHRHACVHIEDRGYQFSDGVYEVISIINGRFIDEDPHLDRLERSLQALHIVQPVSRTALKIILREVIRRNLLRYGIVYFQSTRGVAPRDHGFPKNIKSTLVVMVKHLPKLATPIDPAGISVITVPDRRWARRDIKTIALLPNILAKLQAKEAGADEAWQVDDDGNITEGTSCNAWIVTPAGELITRPATHDILNGITRMRIIRLATDMGLAFVERPFSVAEATQAREAFISSASSFAVPVTKINDARIGDGHVGVLSQKIIAAYERFIHAQC